MAQWVVTTGSTALVTATAKTAVELATGTAITNRIFQIDVTFNGTSATAVPVTVDLISSTATGTGTAITFAAAHQVDSATSGNPISTAKVNLTAEGAGPVVIAAWFVPPTAGVTYQLPLGREYDMKVSQFRGVRLTAPAVVNYIVNVWFEE